MRPEGSSRNTLNPKPNTLQNGNLISPRRTVSSDPWISPRGAGPLLKKTIDNQNTRISNGFFSREKLNTNFNSELPSEFNNQFSQDPIWARTVKTLLPFYQQAIEALRNKNIREYISYLAQMAEIIFDCLFSIYENLEKKENPEKKFDRKKHLQLFIAAYRLYCEKIMNDVHQQTEINSKNWFNYLNRNDLMLREEIDIFINDKKKQAMDELVESITPRSYIKDYQRKNANFPRKIGASISISSALNEQREKNQDKELRAQYYLLDGVANSILPLIETKRCSLCITDNMKKIANQLKKYSHILHLDRKKEKWRLYDCIEIRKIKELSVDESENITTLIKEKTIEEIKLNKKEIEKAIINHIEIEKSQCKDRTNKEINSAILKTVDPDIQLMETKNEAERQLKKIKKRLEEDESCGCFSWLYSSKDNKKARISTLQLEIKNATSSGKIIELLNTCLTDQTIKQHRHRITGLAQGIFKIPTSTESELKSIKINLLERINKIKKYTTKEKLLEISEGLFRLCNPSPNQSPYSNQQDGRLDTKPASKFGQLFSVPEEEDETEPEIDANLIQQSVT